MARKLNNELLRDMAESVADVPDGRMLNNDYLRIIAENFSGGGGGGGTGTVDASSIVGVIPAENLPSYVDDVLEYSSQSALPATGETGKIYVTTDTNTTYRWSGSAYVPISNPIDYATQAEAEAGTENTHVMTPLRTKQAIDANAYELPLMSPTTRGGAKLGHGLAIEDGALGIGEVTDPTDAGPIVELTAKGWAEQDTTVGKNLLMPLTTPKTTNGVTLTTDADGYYVLNGTATSTVFFNCPQAIPAGTYTLSCNNLAAAANRETMIRLMETNTSPLTESNALLNALDSTATFTLSSDAVMWQIRVNSGETLTNFRLKPQLELGSTATSYEPYTGGAPSPSPSYPQEIRRVTGRNLLDESLSKYQKLKEDGTTTAEGSTDAFKTSDYTEVEPSTAYYAQNVIGLSAGYAVAIYDASKTIIRNVTSSGYNVSFGFTTDANARYVRVCYYTPNSDKYVGQPQLELGSVAHPYVPYGCVGVDVTHDGTTTTIPIPLPSRGWVAALPDGTCDTLTLDGAGGYVWELNVKAATVTLNNSVLDITTTGLKGAIFDNRDKVAQGDSVALCDRAVQGLRTRTEADYFYTNVVNTVFVGDADDTIEDLKVKYDGATFYYALATPTTESGYVDGWDNTIPVHASITCPDLTDLIVRCVADAGAAEIAAAWGRKYESRIANLESAVAELIASA